MAHRPRALPALFFFGSIAFFILLILIPQPYSRKLTLTMMLIVGLGFPLLGMFLHYRKEDGLKKALLTLGSVVFCLVFWWILLPAFFAIIDSKSL
jgi:hypothetical protein